MVNKQLTNKFMPKKAKIENRGETFSLPNRSGDHTTGIKRFAPTKNEDLVNKKYVDDNTFWDRSGTDLKPSTKGDLITTENPTQSEFFKIKKIDANALTTITDAVTSVGEVENGLIFDGVNESGDMGQNASIDITGDATVSMWVKVHAYTTAKYIMADYNGGGTTTQQAIGVLASPNRFFVEQIGGTVTIRSAGTDKVQNQWYHLVILRNDTTKKLLMYVDGALEATDNTDYTGTVVALQSSKIFGNSRASHSNWGNFTIDDVAVWDKVLSDNDISDIHNGGTGLKIVKTNTFPTDGGSMGTNLQALWHFNESTGSSSADDSDNTNTITLTNMENEDWVEGIVPTAAGAKTNTIFQSRDGQSGGEFGSVIVGATSVRYSINGKTIRFQIDGSEKAQIDTNGWLGLGTTSPICTLDVNGGIAAALRSETSAYTATTSDHTILCGAGNQSFTVTLPASSGVSGIIYNIKNLGTGTITVDGNSAETIDGATTAIISSQHASITIQCDGSNWHII